VAAANASSDDPVAFYPPFDTRDPGGGATLVQLRQRPRPDLEAMVRARVLRRDRFVDHNEIADKPSLGTEVSATVRPRHDRLTPKPNARLLDLANREDEQSTLPQHREQRIDPKLPIH